MKKTYNLRKVMIVFVCGLLLLNGILYSSGRGAERPKDIVLILKVIDATNDFWTGMIQGAEMAAKEYGVNLTVLGPDAETEYKKQGELIEQAIAMEPDAIALVPSNFTETIPYARKIEAAGIPLILVDSVMEESMGSCVVSTDNIEGGRKMGQFIAASVTDVSSVGIVGHVKGTSTATEREQGLREGLGELEEKVADVVFCDSDYRKAYHVTKEMLERYPEINVIAGLNEYSSVGAAKAVHDLGLAGQIHMIGFDSSIKEVEYLEDGTFDAIVVQRPLNMGYLCIEKAVQLLLGEKVAASVDSGSVLITKETMYTEENQKLLFPF